MILSIFIKFNFLFIKLKFYCVWKLEYGIVCKILNIFLNMGGKNLSNILG